MIMHINGVTMACVMALMQVPVAAQTLDEEERAKSECGEKPGRFGVAFSEKQRTFMYCPEEYVGECTKGEIFSDEFDYCIPENEDMEALKTVCEKSLGVRFGAACRTMPHKYLQCKTNTVVSCEREKVFSNVRDECFSSNEVAEDHRAIRACERDNRYVVSRLNPANFYECQEDGEWPIFYECPKPSTGFNPHTERCEGLKSAQMLDCGGSVDTNSVGLPWPTGDLTYAIFNSTEELPEDTIENCLREVFNEYSQRIPQLQFSLVEDPDMANIKIIVAPLDDDNEATGGLPQDGTLTINQRFDFFYIPGRRKPHGEESRTDGKHDLTDTLLHEIGHTLGLQHVYEPNSVMGICSLKAKFRLSNNDVKALTELYGPDGVMERTLATCAQEKETLYYSIPIGKHDGLICMKDGTFDNYYCGELFFHPGGKGCVSEEEYDEFMNDQRRR